VCLCFFLSSVSFSLRGQLIVVPCLTSVDYANFSKKEEKFDATFAIAALGNGNSVPVRYVPQQFSTQKEFELRADGSYAVRRLIVDIDGLTVYDSAKMPARLCKVKKDQEGGAFGLMSESELFRTIELRKAIAKIARDAGEGVSNITITGGRLVRQGVVKTGTWIYQNYILDKVTFGFGITGPYIEGEIKRIDKPVPVKRDHGEKKVEGNLKVSLLLNRETRKGIATVIGSVRVSVLRPVKTAKDSKKKSKKKSTVWATRGDSNVMLCYAV